MKKDNSKSPNSTKRIVSINLDFSYGLNSTPQIENERRVAIYDILEDNYFAPIDTIKFNGPYNLKLKMELRRKLYIDVYDTSNTLQGRIILILGELRSLCKEYFQICDSYFDAVKRLSPSQIEPIDMARRGMHNDGAEKLKENLASQVEINILTSRRLFTLLSILFTR